MSENDSPEECKFEAYCFSTNFSNFSSITMIKQYLMSVKCSDVEYTNNNNTVSFTHALKVGNNTDVNCKIIYNEISLSSKNIKINEEIDCFIIFFDLEYLNSLDELNKILKLLNTLGDIDKKIYVMSFYTSEINIKINLNEEDMQEYFGRYMLTNYEIMEVEMIPEDKFTNKIDEITIETLKEKKFIQSDSKDYDDKSKSGCILF